MVCPQEFNVVLFISELGNVVERNKCTFDITSELEKKTLKYIFVNCCLFKAIIESVDSVKLNRK